MMTAQGFRPFALLALLCAFAAAHEHKDTGHLKPTKKWGALNFEAAKTSGSPMCIFFVDPEIKSNSMQELLEGKDCLNNAEVKEKLGCMLKLKIKTDGTDVTGWPAEFLKRAANGAALMLCSSDFSHVVFFDKSTPRNQIQPANVMLAIKNIMAYEESRRAVAEKQANAQKKPMPRVEENKTLPGLDTQAAAPNKSDAPGKSEPVDE